ncbi:MAG TPA: terminase [bacterium]|nr:terminase [bacterium]
MNKLRLVAETADGAQAGRTIKRRTAPRKPGRPRKKKPANKGGRPTKYEKSMKDRAYDLCAEAGLTDKQLGTAFGVDEATINRWKREHEDFSKALDKGKDEFDNRHAEASLLKAALGYSYTEIVKERTEDGMIVTREVTKHAAPNPTCLIFWLKNRRSKRWNDKPELNDDDEPFIIQVTNYAGASALSPEEGEKRRPIP